MTEDKKLYVISEEELEGMLVHYEIKGLYTDHIYDKKLLVGQLFKSKQPVELVASANIEFISWKPFKEDPIGREFSGEPTQIYIIREVK